MPIRLRASWVEIQGFKHLTEAEERISNESPLCNGMLGALWAPRGATWEVECTRCAPSGCACAARPGAFCSAWAERMRFWNASWSILLGVGRADALLECVVEEVVGGAVLFANPT